MNQKVPYTSEWEQTHERDPRYQEIIRIKLAKALRSALLTFYADHLHFVKKPFYCLICIFLTYTMFT